jgi:SAM-dependent methyltransferase
LVSRNQWLEDVRRAHIIDPINNDPRETWVNRTRLGYPTDWIFHTVIGGGQANFDEPIAGLSPRDRVMLYALFNQKAHVDELIQAFERLLPDPALLHGATVVDIGCGPFTAGLALANVAGNGVAFRYFGIDLSSAMCEFGQELATAAAAAGGLEPRTTIRFSPGTDGIDFGPRRSEWTVIVLSYLLASASLNVQALCDQIVRACDRIGMGPVAVLYTNAVRETARAKFPQLESSLAAAGFEKKIEALDHLTDGDKPRDIHYALFVRPPVGAILLEHFAS